MLDGLLAGPDTAAVDLEARQNAMEEAIAQNEHVDVLPGRALRGPAIIGAGGKGRPPAVPVEEAAGATDSDDGEFSAAGDPDDLLAFTMTVAS
jgi:hypothetical protein